MRQFISALLIAVLGCSSCFGGQQSDQKHIEKIRKQVSSYIDRDAPVSVETYDQRKFRGFINEAGPDTFQLTSGNQLVTLNYADVKKMKSTMDPRTKKVLISTIFFFGLFGLLAGALSTDR